MPELPEVETVRRGLAPAMTGRTLVRLDLHRPDLRVPFPPRMAARLKGRKILRLDRRAKYLLIHFEGREVMAVHLGMSGRMGVVPVLKGYNLRPHDHMVMALDDGAGVVFNDARRFGMVLLMEEGAMSAHPAFAAMGPEPLPPSFTGKLLREAIGRRRTPIKQALLDQHIVAGVGNIYASEALFAAGISPFLPACALKAADADRLAAAIRSVLERAIEAGGSTLRDYRNADGAPGYFQHAFAVYDREGQACPSCAGGGRKKGIIEKTVQGGRATYFCPSCQKAVRKKDA